MFRILINSFLIVVLSCISVLAKGYQGASWVDNTCKYHSGSSWVDCTKNHYNGTAWVAIEAGGGSCAGGSNGVLGQSTSPVGTSGAACGSSCPNSIMYYSAFTPSEDGTVSFVHAEIEYAGAKIRLGVFSSSGILLASSVEFTGSDTAGEEVHKALISDLCLVAATTYILGTWIESDAWAGAYYAGAWGSGIMHRRIMSSFGNLSGTEETEIASYRIRMSVNNSASSF